MYVDKNLILNVDLIILVYLNQLQIHTTKCPVEGQENLGKCGSGSVYLSEKWYNVKRNMNIKVLNFVINT